MKCDSRIRHPEGPRPTDMPWKSNTDDGRPDDGNKIFGITEKYQSQHTAYWAVHTSVIMHTKRNRQRDIS